MATARQIFEFAFDAGDGLDGRVLVAAYTGRGAVRELIAQGYKDPKLLGLLEPGEDPPNGVELVQANDRPAPSPVPPEHSLLHRRPILTLATGVCLGMLAYAIITTLVALLFALPLEAAS